MRRSKFSLSHTKLFSCDLGQLVPCALLEVLPGDTFQHQTSLLVRASPLLAPVMHPVDVRIHHWYVPLRIIWHQFESFITGGDDGLDNTAYPTRAFGTHAVKSLADYLGYPLASGTSSVLPFRCYAKIWNEFYRDQDLETEAAIWYDSGNDGVTSTALKNCGWEKDYFTSSRPWEQKGPSITIPLGSTAPVVFSETGTTPQTVNLKRTGASANTQLLVIEGGTTNAPIIGTTDLSSASAITVTALREALALQRFEENRARFGSRYPEMLRSWGVRSSDSRLQRPEYLGGGRQTIQFSEVLQTAEGTNPVGELRGHGVAAFGSNRYRRFFEEHGYVISLFSVRPKTMYMQGFPRTLNRRFKEDYFQPELQHIGQQEVLNKEVYATHATPEGVFGYQDRYDEYRRHESSVSGEFRNSTLWHWHLARQFTSDPALNNTFVSCVPTERVFAVPSKDVLWVQAKHSIQARRLVAQSGKSFIY